MSYHHAPVRPRRAEEKGTHPAELTGFILLTVTAICAAKSRYIRWQFLQYGRFFFSPSPIFFFRKSQAEAPTTPGEIWTQPSLQNKPTASVKFTVRARAAGGGGVGCGRRRATSEGRFRNISVSVPSSLAKARSPAVAAAGATFVALSQREGGKKREREREPSCAR